MARNLPVRIPQTPVGLMLFWWVRWRILCASAKALKKTPLKLSVIVVVWGVLFVGLYWLSLRGLTFVNKTAGLGPFLLDRLWYLFLFVVIVMLAVSQLASGYSTLVRSNETRWWMGLPLSARTICRAKWVESSAYSSWAVLLLVVPLGLAYLVVLDKPLWLIAWLVVGLLIPLVAIITALSTVILLVWLRFLGRVAVRREILAVGFVVVCGIFFWMLGEQGEKTQGDAWFVAMQELLPRMRIAMAPWLPSSWAAKSLSGSLNGRWFESFAYAGLLISSAALCWRVLDHFAAAYLLPVLQREGHRSQTEIRQSKARELTVPWWARHPIKSALIKDIFLVIRDPMQWTQGVVFFGLLGAYFANIHRLQDMSVDPSWRIGVASLNLACTLLVFGSLAVRFLFPQMSLEGRSLWLLRIAPNGIRNLIIAKLGLYSLLAVFVTEGLLWLSVTRLEVPVMIGWWFGVVGIIASVTLVAMMVGLGAWWIDPTSQDPSRIVSSSSGALALVCMLFYIGCVIVALEIAWSSWVAASPVGLLAATAGLIAVSFLASWLPVRQGLAKLEHLEQAS